MKLVLGIDTGGTYTDAAICDAATREVVASAKAQTTREDLSIGIGEVMDRLPPELLGQVESLSLSTTLATNACVEDKGGRAKLIFIGAERETVEETGRRYGLPPVQEIYFLDAGISFDGTVETEPDWEKFAGEMPDFLKDADAAAVVAYQGIKNPALEQRAKEMISGQTGLFTVCGHELFWSLNYIKRGASTLLNARLVPVITEFLKAVRRNMDKRGLHVPIVIVRSDGTLMSEAFALHRPVETILCGPAASVLGGMSLSGRRDCLVVDMGGTTTDIALIRNGVPVKGEGGVAIGRWDTFVDSVYIHTFGLGGDSWVRPAAPGESGDGLLVGPQRVMPLCAAASRWPEVRRDLEELAANPPVNTHPLSDFFTLVQDISDDPLYNRQEQEVCRALRGGAKRIDKLAQAVGADLYTLDLKRLEREGRILRCAFTPTDAMHIRGEFTRFDAGASLAAARFLAFRMKTTPEEFCARVMERVSKEVYVHCVRALLENIDPAFKKGVDAGFMKMIEMGWDRREAPDPLLHLFCRTGLTLVGLGASTHLFLPAAAKALGAECLVPENAAVANAVGAVSGRISASVTARVSPAGGFESDGFFVLTPRSRQFFVDYDEALAAARTAAGEEAKAEAGRRGCKGELLLSFSEDRQSAVVGHTGTAGSDLLLAVEVTATASGSAGF